MANQIFDVAIIGGGIYGACIAWDSALRGLSTALIERGDFGQATSANSLKTIHGGLRYLQDADLSLIRMMVNERKAFLKIAPHLVHPLPCIMPTYNRLMKSKPLMAVALKVNDLLAFDRNQGQDPQKYLPGGKVISRDECLEILPGLPDRDLTGAAVWSDAQVYNTERFTLSIIKSSVLMGAVASNYVEATGLNMDSGRVNGIRAKDVLNGDEFDILARVVVNASGPWVDQVLTSIYDERAERKFLPSAAMNIVTRQIIPNYAAGIPTRHPGQDGNLAVTGKSQVLFIAPWRHFSLVGTFHYPFDGRPNDHIVTQELVEESIERINSAFPKACIKPEDIYQVHTGLLPAKNKSLREVKLIRKTQITDHQNADGIGGLISVVGVKYTSSRYAAEKATDLVFQKLGRESPVCRTHETPLIGGDIERFDDFLRSEISERLTDQPEGILRHLIYNFGSEYQRILHLSIEDPRLMERICPSSDVLKAEIVYAIREEMAQTLGDVVLRRTDLGSAGKPSGDCLYCCAAIMAVELGWDKVKQEQEVYQVSSRYWPGMCS